MCYALYILIPAATRSFPSNYDPSTIQSISFQLVFKCSDEEKTKTKAKTKKKKKNVFYTF